MHHLVAAIRHGGLRTRFATPSAHGRERQLGLRRASQLRLASSSVQLTGGPALAAVRAAARSFSGLKGGSAGALSGAPQPLHGPVSLLRPKSINWSGRPQAGTNLSRGRSTTPWRG